jgi:hypothetical protein
VGAEEKGEIRNEGSSEETESSRTKRPNSVRPSFGAQSSPTMTESQEAGAHLSSTTTDARCSTERQTEASLEKRIAVTDPDPEPAVMITPAEEDLERLFDLNHDPLTEPRGGPTKEWLEEMDEIQPRSLVAPSPQIQTETVRQILTSIENEPAEPSPEVVRETKAAISNLAGQIPNAEEFVAGSFQAYLPAWKALLAGSERASTKQVLRWLEHGFVPRFVETAEAPEKNKRAVRSMLARVMTAPQIEEFLKGRQPGRVEFKNHRSFYNHWPFASKEVANLFTVRAATLLPKGAEKPVLVHPFGVALTAGKERLICDARALNLFLKNLPFQYEKLRDVLAYTKAGFFMVTWDLKSGYYHVPIHPAYRKFFGFKIGDRYGVYNVICFGLSEACFAFTKIAQEPLIELRSRGFPVSGYIDDGHSAAKTYGRTIRQGYLIIRLLAAIGAFFGLPKCNLIPLQELRWLGFLLNTRDETFKVAPSKLAKIKAVLHEAIEKGATTNRELAALAGKLVALSPAVLPALLFSRAIFQAMKGQDSWDAWFPSPEAVRTEAQVWLDNLDKWNGRPWWPRQVQLTLSIDASALGYGGFIQEPSGRAHPVAGTFDEQEAQLSSAARETIGYVRAIQVASQLFLDTLRESALLLLGDSQAALSALHKFASPSPAIHEQLKQLFTTCAIGAFDIIPRWIPRESLSEADELSRRPDASDWGCTPELVSLILNHFQVSVQLDLFASDAHHVTSNFISAFFVPGCIAIHALAQDWNSLLPNNSATVWAFPSTKHISATLTILEKQRIKAILLVPARQASNEWIQIHHLSGAVEGPFYIPRQPELCRPSLRVPSAAINPILMGLAAFYIHWNLPGKTKSPILPS